jgi:hypothetical protein
LNLYKLKQDEWEELIVSQRKKSLDTTNSRDAAVLGEEHEISQDDLDESDKAVDKPADKSKRMKRNMFGLDDINIPDIVTGPVVSMSEADRVSKKARKKRSVDNINDD